MPWTVPLFGKAKIDAAGDVLVAYDPSDAATWVNEAAYLDALPVVNNWRSSHSFPLNTFQVTLRDYARRVDQSPLIAQRIKRLTSIESKLRRFPGMRLSQMQDLGGCRAVVSSIEKLRALALAYERSKIKHTRSGFKDYVATPQSSGYRGVHLVYRYASDKSSVYNGLRVEVQLRSQAQHAWATAVETVGTFVKQALKSSVGEPEWLRFFAIMGSVIAWFEKTPRVPNTPEDPRDLLNELSRLAAKLKVASRLETYRDALQTLQMPSMQKAHYFLLLLDANRGELSVRGFRSNELARASSEYLEAEKLIRDWPGMDAVLVSVDSVNALQRAYPNYFADTRAFVELLDRALARRARMRARAT